MRNTVIIGGGPAGLMAAISSAKNEDKVTIIEKCILVEKITNHRKRKMQYNK